MSPARPGRRSSHMSVSRLAAPRMKNPAPASSIIASANWPVMSAYPRAVTAAAVAPRPPLFSVSLVLMRPVNTAGPMPQRQASGSRRPTQSSAPSSPSESRTRPATVAMTEPSQGSWTRPRKGARAASRREDRGSSTSVRMSCRRDAPSAARTANCACVDRAREQQVRQVRAGDQQNEAREAEQHAEELPAGGARRRLRQALAWPAGLVVVFRKVGGHSCAERGDEGVPCARRHARVAPAENADRLRDSVHAATRRLNPSGLKMPTWPKSRFVIAGGRRQHADNLVRRIVSE